MVSDLKSLHKLYYARLHETRVKTSKKLTDCSSFPEAPETRFAWGFTQLGCYNFTFNERI